VLVVTEGVAKAYWPGRSAVGESLSGEHGTPYRIVGVVADARYESWDRSSWVAYGSYPSLAMSNRPNLLVRSPTGRAVPVADILRVLASFDPAVHVTRVNQLDTLLTDSIRPRRFESWLFGSFAAAALLVVWVGVLGIVGMATARRTREVGIRMALGATREHLVSLLFREQFLAVAGGLAAGGVLSAWAVQFVKAYMYELTAYDARLWIAAVIAIVLAASMGTAIPAWRASRVDPVQALRTD
jgi:predicted lysophospholipase L1 biosynthesis ABC-type transport system permease subunit